MIAIKRINTWSYLIFGLLLVGLLGSAVFYSPGKDGPLVLDDISSISSNPNIRVTSVSQSTFADAIYSANYALHQDYAIPYRGLSYFSFALNYYFADNILQELKLTNIFLHVLCGALIFALARRILGLLSPQLLHPSIETNRKLRDLIALTVALVWVLHPLYTSTVLYITQRMTILSGLFVFLTVYAYVDYRSAFLAKNQGLWRGIPLIFMGTTAAFFSKENGILAPLLCLVVELVFFRFKFHPHTSRFEKATLLSLLVVPFLVIVIYLIDSYIGQSQREVITRDFTATERLMTQWRILWQYISHLVLIGEQGIHFYQDNQSLSKGLFNPVTTIFSLLAWLVVGAGTVWSVLKNKAPLFSFAVLWFLMAHILESSILPLELKFEHRNYVPGFSIILALIFGLFYIVTRAQKKVVVAGGSVAFCLVALLAWSVHPHIKAWSSYAGLVEFAYERAPDSSRVLVQKANLALVQKDRKLMHQYFADAAALKESEAGYGLLSLSHYCQNKEALDESLILQARERLKEGVPTVMTFNGFSRVMAFCNSEEYDAALNEIYINASKSRFKRLAANGMLMLAYIEARKGDEQSYVTFVEKAKSLALTSEVAKEVAKLK